MQAGHYLFGIPGIVGILGKKHIQPIKGGTSPVMYLINEIHNTYGI